jgi:hypothetical protein
MAAWQRSFIPVTLVNRQETDSTHSKEDNSLIGKLVLSADFIVTINRRSFPSTCPIFISTVFYSTASSCININRRFSLSEDITNAFEDEAS